MSLGQETDITQDPPILSGLTSPRAGMTARAMIVGAIMGAVACVWSLQSDAVLATCRVGEAVPAIPAIAAVLLLVIVNAASLKIWRKRLFSAGDIAVSYTTAAIGAMFASYGVMLYFYSFVMAFMYYATPENGLANYQHLIPTWYQPRSGEVIRQFYEGGPGIPWHAWTTPLAAWSVFFLALFGGSMCLARLFHNDWAHRERLTYPIAQFVASLADTEQTQAGRRTLLANPLTWIGVGLAALYNILNFANTFNPAIPAIPSWIPLSSLFMEHPWTAFVRTGGYGFAFKTSPTIIGIAYFVPLDQAFSVCFFFLLMRFANVAAVAAGYDNAGSPFTFQQSAGAYMAVFAVLVWSARRGIFVSARRLWNAQYAAGEDAPPRWALAGAVAGIAIVIAWLVLSGMALWLTLCFVAMYVGFAITYARARAEAGVPVNWVYPNYQHKEMILATFGTQYLLDHGGPSNIMMLWYYGFLSRGYLQSTIALHSDTFKLGEDTRSHPLAQTIAGAGGILLAVLVCHFIILRVCYQQGFNSFYGTPLSVGMQAAESVGPAIEHPSGPEPIKAIMGLVGVIIAGGLTAARHIWLRFPLHPLGYAMAMAYGEILWGPFLVSGIIKALVIHIGGVGAYRRLQAGFLGLVLGHALFGGIINSLMQMANPDLFRRYLVDFG